MSIKCSDEECYSRAEFAWDNLYCDRHLLECMQVEVADNAPEDMFRGPVVMLNLCTMPGCDMRATYTTGDYETQYCHEHTMAGLPETARMTMIGGTDRGWVWG